MDDHARYHLGMRVEPFAVAVSDAILPTMTGLDTVIIGGPHAPARSPPDRERLQHSSHFGHISTNRRSDAALGDRHLKFHETRDNLDAPTPQP
jgi:hypothetical protein